MRGRAGTFWESDYLKKNYFFKIDFLVQEVSEFSDFPYEQAPPFSCAVNQDVDTHFYWCLLLQEFFFFLSFLILLLIGFVFFSGWEGLCGEDVLFWGSYISNRAKLGRKWLIRIWAPSAISNDDIVIHTNGIPKLHNKICLIPESWYKKCERIWFQLVVERSKSY